MLLLNYLKLLPLSTVMFIMMELLTRILLLIILETFVVCLDMIIHHLMSLCVYTFVQDAKWPEAVNPLWLSNLLVVANPYFAHFRRCLNAKIQVTLIRSNSENSEINNRNEKINQYISKMKDVNNCPFTQTLRRWATLVSYCEFIACQNAFSVLSFGLFTLLLSIN